MARASGVRTSMAASPPRLWRKLHLAVDADTGEIIAEVLTDQNTSDISQLAALLEQIAEPIARFTADGAYDSERTYKAVRCHSLGASIVVPPHAEISGHTSWPTGSA